MPSRLIRRSINQRIWLDSHRSDHGFKRGGKDRVLCRIPDPCLLHEALVGIPASVVVLVFTSNQMPTHRCDDCYCVVTGMAILHGKVPVQQYRGLFLVSKVRWFPANQYCAGNKQKGRWIIAPLSLMVILICCVLMLINSQKPVVHLQSYF